MKTENERNESAVSSGVSSFAFFGSKRLWTDTALEMLEGYLSAQQSDIVNACHDLADEKLERGAMVDGKILKEVLDSGKVEGLARYYNEPSALLGKEVRGSHRHSNVPEGAIVTDCSLPDTVYISTYTEDGKVDERIGNRGLADIAFANPADELSDKIMEVVDWWAAHPNAEPDPRALRRLQIYLPNFKARNLDLTETENQGAK